MTAQRPNDGKSLGRVRSAEVATTQKGTTIGVCVYLSSEEIEALGIDIDHVEELTYFVDEKSQELVINGGRE
ncbi:hypothetical protein [Haloferax sp. YSSS75]|uniref:hypothetical protein n=1 Tax=Haloferax sp. YSSS75 TaxID=3388564 RepID=UPI00398D1227